ncbi:MAG: hypothetical protein R3B69_04440 [Candidatus Paceibacterota bacterium]
MKTFLRDGDLHTKRLLETVPGKEPNTYIHPVIGVPEHVYGEEELTDWLGKRFTVHKVYRSHKHISQGKANKRRTVSVYAEKIRIVNQAKLSQPAVVYSCRILSYFIL